MSSPSGSQDSSETQNPERSQLPASESRQRPLTFISVSDPSVASNPAIQRQARSHAITFALERQRRQARVTGGHFKEETPQTMRKRLLPEKERDEQELLEVSKRSSSMGGDSVDPFETLPVNAKRLTSLLHQKSSLSAGEPIFSVINVLWYQGLRPVFEAGLEDGALTAALTLTLAFAANGGKLDNECLDYKSKAMQQISHRLSIPELAASTTTIGSVLMLLGIEVSVLLYRLGERINAQTHLRGLQMLLRLCEQRSVTLPRALRRAIFWQDLFASLIAGTERIASYQMFPTQYPYNALDPRLRVAPPGFTARVLMLGQDFVEITAGIDAMYKSRGILMKQPRSAEDLEKVESLQAWVESRLLDLRSQSGSNSILVSCILAAFLCVYGFWDEIWNSAFLPRILSMQVLQHLQVCETWSGWERNSDLLLWLINIGSSFAVDADVRLGFARLRDGENRRILDLVSASWEDVEVQLRRFIWSDIFYSPATGSFWERIEISQR